MKTTVGLMAALLCFSTPVLAQNYPTFTGKYVIDAANVIPDEQEVILNRKLIAYKRSSTNEFAVVTVGSLEGIDIQSYSTGLFTKLGVGKKGINNGLLLLVAPKEKKVRIQVGQGLQTILTDVESSRLIRDVITPQFKNRDIPKGIELGIEAITKEVVGSPAEMQALQAKIKSEEAYKDRQSSANFWDAILTILLLGLVALSGWLIYLLATRKQRLEKKRLEEKQRIADKLALEKRREAARAREKQQQQERRDEQMKLQKLREDKLAAMTPTARAAFLAAEEALVAEQRRVATARRQALLRDEEERRQRRLRQQEREEQERRSRQDDSSDFAVFSVPSFDSSPDPPSFSTSDDTDSFSGGTSDGGGADGSWD